MAQTAVPEVAYIPINLPIYNDTYDIFADIHRRDLSDANTASPAEVAH